LYKEDEVFAARTILDNYGDRLPKRKSNDKIQATLDDIVKAMLDPDHAVLRRQVISLKAEQSKYEHLYSSYHVAISVDTADIKRAVDVFMSADVWPCGVFVKRYFNRRDGYKPNQE